MRPGRSYEQRRHACTALRKSLRVSQSSLSSAISIPRERLNRFENGRVMLNEEDLIELERALAHLREQRLEELRSVAC